MNQAREGQSGKTGLQETNAIFRQEFFKILTS
jgi:hypothetical protein